MRHRQTGVFVCWQLCGTTRSCLAFVSRRPQLTERSIVSRREQILPEAQNNKKRTSQLRRRSNARATHIWDVCKGHVTFCNVVQARVRLISRRCAGAMQNQSDRCVLVERADRYEEVPRSGCTYRRHPLPQRRRRVGGWRYRAVPVHA